MNLHFICAGNVEMREGKPYSDLASARYRVLIPALELLKLGHEMQVFNTSAMGGQIPEEVLKCDVMIFSKSFTSVNTFVAKEAKKRGARIVLDMCDNHFDLGPEVRDHVVELAKLSDGLVASTPAMAKAIMEHVGRAATVISDPFEGARDTARGVQDPQKLNLVWFGHSINVPSLIEQLGPLAEVGNERKIHLNVVTGDVQKLHQVFSQMKAMGLPLELSVTPWSLPNTFAALQASDAVLITTAGTPAFKAVKSPNRVIEPLWAGRMVIANPLPAYEPFRGQAILCDSMADGIREFLKLTDEDVKGRIQKAQSYINQNHAPEVIGRQWGRVLEALKKPVAVSSEVSAPAQQGTQSEPIRLNLGCGDKILPGYVNVDVVASRAGKEPDVLCDLRDLSSFESNYADEILSVHVVEHFWRWEVLDILKEWVRVLKPGGKMIVECPNLISACETLLTNPDLASGPGPEGQRSMWVFYGDPSWQDPLMIHRWAYTPRSLAQLLHEAGLSDLKQEPAQFKLREPRDMRITGIKP